MTAGKTVKKKTAKKPTRKADRKATRKPAGEAPAKPSAKKRTRAEAKQPETATSTVTAADVNLGHVFALRPRVEVSFAAEHLRRAKDQLAGQTWASLPEAARAVAEKALATAHEAPSGRRG